MNPTSPFASQSQQKGGTSEPPVSAERYDTLQQHSDTPGKPTGANARPAPVLFFQPGAEVVSGYHLVRMIGRGGFGEVWEATGPGGFPLALKFVQLHGSGSYVELRSLEVMKNIRHPHLLGMFGAWKTSDYLIIAMELAEKTLKDRLEECIRVGQPGIPTLELLEFMREAAKGIDYLNEPVHKSPDGSVQGIQHRDIKPQNLLLVGGSVKVADFGLAKLLEQSVESASGSMSPAYAAPEFCSGQATRWSDQYSLAVTYCQLRGNRLPFTGNLAQLVAGHLSHAPDLSMIPMAREREILSRALLKQPAARWPTCREFVEQIAIALGFSQTTSRPSQVLEELESIDTVNAVPPPLPRGQQAGTGSRTATGSRTTQMTQPPPLPPQPPLREEPQGGRGMRTALLTLAALLFFATGIGITFFFLRDTNHTGTEVAAKQDKGKEDAVETHKAEPEKSKADEATRKVEEEKQRQTTEEKRRFEEEKKKWEQTRKNLEDAAARERAEREELERRKREADKEIEAERQRRLAEKEEEQRRIAREQREADRRAAEARQAAAMKYKAVARVGNRCLDKVTFAIRWRLWDDTWTSWQEDTIEADQTWIYNRAGARAGELRYSRLGQEQVVSLQTVQIDASADIHKARSPHHHFWSDNSARRFDLTDEVEEQARLKLRGVTVIDNPSQASSGVIAYRIRWRQADGHSWTKWNDFKVKNGYHYVHSMPGATGLQVEFDHVGGDDKYTPKVYDLDFNLIPAQQEAKQSDGRYYYFEYKDQNTLDIFKKS